MKTPSALARPPLSPDQSSAETFEIVADPTPVTVPDLVARYRASLGRPAWLVPIPEKWLERSLQALGQNATWERLGRPLVASSAKLIAMGWNPAEPPSAAPPNAV